MTYNVLIVTDSISEGKLLKQYLQSDMFNIPSFFDDANDALEEMKHSENKYDIICVNFNLPEANSFDIVKKVRSIYPNIITVIIAGNITKEIIRDLQGLRVNALILRPFSKAQVFDKFAEILGRKDLIRKVLVNVNTESIDLSSITIPPMPTVMMNVLSFDSEKMENGSFELEKIINPDKAITLDIIRIANSSFYGRSGSVKSLKDAITLLGLKTVKNLVILQSRKQLGKGVSGEIFKKHITEIPILTSLVALDLVEPLSLGKIRDGLFTFALFRKMGMLVMAENFPRRYLEVLKRLEFGLQTIYQLEKEEFNSDSIEVGLRVFKYWRLPKEFQDLMANQNFDESNIQNVSDYDRITMLAELISKKLLSLPVTQAELKMETLIFDFYKAPWIVRETFDKEYFDLIKEHPYFTGISG
ncbi:MAG: response regulator [Leptospira sp.]|nr:response regulator [Leptospira sp.]